MLKVFRPLQTAWGLKTPRIAGVFPRDGALRSSPLHRRQARLAGARHCGSRPGTARQATSLPPHPYVRQKPYHMARAGDPRASPVSHRAQHTAGNRGAGQGRLPQGSHLSRARQGEHLHPCPLGRTRHPASTTSSGLAGATVSFFDGRSGTPGNTRRSHFNAASSVGSCGTSLPRAGRR